jgi:alpha-amylase
MHSGLIEELFGKKPTAFRNTELIYNNYIASQAEHLGFSSIVCEGAEKILGWRSPYFVYKPTGTKAMRAVLKDYKLSDDIAFRFGSRDWGEWPLTADKFARWVNGVNGNGHVVGLFMDYETVGEHQWADTGIFEFWKHLPGEVLKLGDKFVTVSEAAKFEPVGEIDVQDYVSWADTERDLSAWKSNDMQHAALQMVYDLEQQVLASMDDRLIEDWRRLLTSDHYYYMCTKWFADGDVHKYFNPYESPYEAFIAFANAVNDLRLRSNK